MFELCQCEDAQALLTDVSNKLCNLLDMYEDENAIDTQECGLVVAALDIVDKLLYQQ